MGLSLGPFSVPFLDPKTGPNLGPLFDRFWVSFWLQNVARNGYKAPQKASKRHRSAPRRAPSGCASAVLALYEKATKTLYFAMVLVPPSCQKATRREPKTAHEAMLYAQKRPRRQHKSHSASELRNRPEKDAKKTPKRVPETSPKRVRIEVRKKVRKRRASACATQRRRIPDLDHVRALILCNVLKK